MKEILLNVLFNWIKKDWEKTIKQQVGKKRFKGNLSKIIALILLHINKIKALWNIYKQT